MLLDIGDTMRMDQRPILHKLQDMSKNNLLYNSIRLIEKN